MGHTTHGFACSRAFSRASRPAQCARLASQRSFRTAAQPYFGTPMHYRAPGFSPRPLGKHGSGRRSTEWSLLLRNTSHIAALGAYLRQATDEGFVIIIANSDPSMRTVAPAGSREAQLAPNPLAFGYPTQDEPVLIDISTSSVANGWVRRWNAEGKRLPGKWLLDANGNPSRRTGRAVRRSAWGDVAAGRHGLGHKGFALGLIVEVLTAGLSGTGRADKPTGGGTPVFIQVIDPEGIRRRDALKREASWLAQACRSSKPRPGVGAVRMPGDTARSRRRAQLNSGVELYPSIMPELKIWADRFGITAPPDRQ